MEPRRRPAAEGFISRLHNYIIAKCKKNKYAIMQTCSFSTTKHKSQKKCNVFFAFCLRPTTKRLEKGFCNRANRSRRQNAKKTKVSTHNHMEDIHSHRDHCECFKFFAFCNLQFCSADESPIPDCTITEHKVLFFFAVNFVYFQVNVISSFSLHRQKGFALEPGARGFFRL